MQISELLLSKPVVYRERKFRELVSVSKFTGFLLNQLPHFTLESLFIKNIFIIKNLTDFRKTVETGMDSRLLGLCYGVFADQFISRLILGHFFPPE